MHPSLHSQPLRLCAALVLVLAPASKADSAHGTLSVSMQVLSSCATLVAMQTATVTCPPGLPFALTRSQSTRTLPDASEITLQTVTIRY
jgi:hypothetical protein